MARLLFHWVFCSDLPIRYLAATVLENLWADDSKDIAYLISEFNLLHTVKEMIRTETTLLIHPCQTLAAGWETAKVSELESELTSAKESRCCWPHSDHRITETDDQTRKSTKEKM